MLSIAAAELTQALVAPAASEALLEAIQPISLGRINALLLREAPSSPEMLGQYMLRVGNQLGEPFIDPDEAADFIQPVVPSADPSLIGSQASSSSEVGLRLHTENPGSERTPDWVIIGCVSNREKAVTYISDPFEALLSLDGLTQAILREAAIEVSEPEAFAYARGATVRTKSTPVQVFRDDEVYLDFEAMTPNGSPEEQAALAQLETSCEERCEELVLSSGDILVLNNRRLVHGRSAFTPDPDNARHLLRLFVG